jgi:hypothetical protein
LTHKDEQGFGENREKDTSLQVFHTFQPDQYGKKILQIRNQTVRMSIPSQKKWNSPQTWMHLLNGRLLI